MHQSAFIRIQIVYHDKHRAENHSLNSLRSRKQVNIWESVVDLLEERRLCSTLIGPALISPRCCLHQCMSLLFLFVCFYHCVVGLWSRGTQRLLKSHPYQEQHLSSTSCVTGNLYTFHPYNYPMSNIFRHPVLQKRKLQLKDINDLIKKENTSQIKLKPF